MRSILKHYFNGLRRIWIRNYGLSKDEAEQMAERTRGRDYYKLFDEIYRTAHQAGAQQLFDAKIYSCVYRIMDQFLARYGIEGRSREGIEFGCGEGVNTLYLAQRGFHIAGVDISSAAIARAQQFAAQAGLSIPYRVGDVLDLHGYETGQFDFGINIGCLHMLVLDDHRRRHIREMWRVLKPGGVLLSFNETARRDVQIKDAERYLASFIAVDETKQVDVEGRKAEIQFKGVGFRKASESQYRAAFQEAGFEILHTEIYGLEPRWKQLLRRGRSSSQLYLIVHARKTA